MPDPTSTSRHRFDRRCLLATGVLLGFGLSWARAEPPPPSTAGSGVAATATPAREIEVVDLEWFDGARQREVPARLYLPPTLPGTAPSPVPLIVFSHGLGGSRFGYSHLGRHWAAQGFASLHLQHRGSDRAVWTQGLFDLVANLQAAASDANAIARARDVSFGITTLLADPRLGARVNPAQIAVAGHSYGANTALLVAGATVARQVDGEWRDIQLRDERIRAAVLLSTPPFYGEPNPRAILSTVRVPTLHVTGSEDVIRIPGYRSDASDRIRVFEAMPSGPGAAPRALAVFAGGTHSIFTDRIDQAGFELNRSVKAATRELTTEFLLAALRGEPFERVSTWLQDRRALLSRSASVPAEGALMR